MPIDWQLPVPQIQAPPQTVNVGTDAGQPIYATAGGPILMPRPATSGQVATGSLIPGVSNWMLGAGAGFLLLLAMMRGRK